MTTLKDAIKAIESFRNIPKEETSIADDLLGKYKGIIPNGKTSTETIREMRNNLYGKINP